MDIDDFKELGIDGFNLVFFFKEKLEYYWERCICKIVREFFIDEKFFKIFNYIVIIFVFKCK